MLQEFTTRQYSSLPGPRFPLSSELRETVARWAEWLPVSAPRSVNLVAKKPVVIYTDAEGTGHCAAVVFDGTKKASCVTHIHLPQWMLKDDSDTGIFEFELAAICLGVCIAVDRFPGRPILICADNQGARGAVIRGTCRTHVGRLLSSFLWRTAANTSSMLWIEFLRSGLNVADAPSRFCTGNNPKNMYTQNAPEVDPPMAFLQSMGSQKALENIGMCPTPFNPAEWTCPKHE